MDFRVDSKLPLISKPYVCEYCGRAYALKTSRNRHYRKLHKLQTNIGKAKCPFASCDFSCKLRRDLRIHLNSPDTHNIAFSCYQRLFKSMSDFTEWKAAEEEKTNTHFILCNKSRSLPDGTVPFYYWCHRSGYHKLSENFKSNGRLRKTAKINATCPAAMNVRVYKGRVALVYHKTHVGHGDELEVLKLRKSEKDYIAGKLLQGLSFEKILEDIANDESLAGQRIKMANKADLRNIMKSYGVPWKKEISRDLKNTDDWVKQLKDLSFSPVLLYKPHHTTDRHSNLYKRDFMLSIMTDGQKQIFEMLPKSVIGINCSLESNSHRFFLITVFIVDETGTPFPIAYCLTNRIDEMGVKTFLNSLKKQVGKIDASLLISDNYQNSHKAWVEVMGVPVRHVLYFPHLKHTWKRKLFKVSGDKENQEVLYNLLVTLSKDPDCTQFNLLLKSFIDLVKCDESLKEFSSYFEKNFLSKVNMWAFCYYSDAGVPTLTYLEEIHERIRDTCFYEGTPKGVDLCIRELLLLTHDKVYTQLIKLYNDTEFLEQMIVQNHQTNKQLDSADIECVQDSVKWRIKMLDDDSVYSVQKREIRCSDKRELYCPLCQVFLDAYTCNCVDYLLMCVICEHVHAIARLSEKCEFTTYTSEVADAIVHMSDANFEVISCEEVVEFAEPFGESNELKSSDTTNLTVPLLLNNCNVTIEGQCEDMKQNSMQYVYILQE